MTCAPGPGAPSALIPLDGGDHFTVLDELLQPNGKLLSLVKMIVG